MLEVIFYAMGVLVGVSLLAKLISTFTIRKMVKEAAEIQKSNHKLMKLVKAKFEHASMVSDRVQNVGAFVDKYLYEYKVCGIRLNNWRNLPKKGLLVILGVFAICESIRKEGFVDATVEYIQWTGIFLLLLLLIQFLSGEKTQLQAARNYMVEYLENVCVHRYAKRHGVNQETSVEQSQAETVQAEIEKDDMQVESVTEAAKGEEVQKVEPIAPQIRDEYERSQQEMRIRAILEEFLA